MEWEVPETDPYAYSLALAHAWREPILADAIQDLDPLPGSRGLDAGCGIGLPALMLAEAVGPGGHVTGLDISPRFLAYGERFAEQAGLSERVSFKDGDVRQVPFNDASFDSAWSVDCVGYAAILEPLPTIQELARVVKPGGVVALLMYSSQQMLPGYPELEARLNATPAGIGPFKPGMRPERHYYRALGWFRELGLEAPTVRALVGSVHAPLSEDLRLALAGLLDMRWGGARSELSPEDWADYLRLSQPDSPEFVLNLPDYYAFFTYSLFQGRVAR